MLGALKNAKSVECERVWIFAFLLSSNYYR